MNTFRPNRPFFTIITCTRNSAGFLARNIASVSSQTFKSYEQIFVDGNSTDDTKSVIRSLVKHPQIYLQDPRGISAAMNLGITRSRGKYLLFLHSDDWLHDPQVLNDVHRFLSDHSGLDWIYARIHSVNADGAPIGVFPRHRLLQFSSRWLLRLTNYIPHQSVFIRREVFTRLGDFDESLASSMDYDYWLRISEHTHWWFFPREISYYTLRSGAQSSSKANFLKNKENLRTVQRRHNNILLRPVIYFTSFVLGCYSRSLLR